MEIEIKETDSLFTDSPDAGHIDCKCSRCKKTIPEEESPFLRCFDEDSNTEYRFCWSCSAEMGIKFNTD